jgi:hypothetical protein
MRTRYRHRTGHCPTVRTQRGKAVRRLFCAWRLCFSDQSLNLSGDVQTNILPGAGSPFWIGKDHEWTNHQGFSLSCSGRYVSGVALRDQLGRVSASRILADGWRSRKPIALSRSGKAIVSKGFQWFRQSCAASPSCGKGQTGSPAAVSQPAQRRRSRPTRGDHGSSQAGGGI